MAAIVVLPAQASHAQVTTTPGLSPSLTTGGGAAPSGPDAGSSLVSSGLLNGLSQLSIGDISRFVGANSTAVTDLLAAPPAAANVAVWWDRLDDVRQSALVQAAPQLVGNLEGVPFIVRDRANRTLLGQSIREAQEAADSGTTSPNGDPKQVLEMLRSVSSALEGEPKQPKRSLLALDTVYPGRAAVVVGDLSTADYVSVLVPGMYFSVKDQLVDWTATAQTLYTAERAWQDYFRGGARSERPDEGIATVAWIGYHTPELGTVGSERQAMEGARFLEQALSGIRSARPGHEPYVSVLGHSYGSTAALITLRSGQVSVDALALMGTPGSETTQSVKDLDVANGNVWVGGALLDPVVGTGFFGTDPGSAAFGARSFDVEGGEDPLSNTVLDGSFGHNEYFKQNSRSLRNLALIALGRGELAAETPSFTSIGPVRLGGITR